MRDKRNPKDVCGEANGTVARKGGDIFFAKLSRDKLQHIT